MARGLGVEPQALGVDPARTVPVAPAPVGTAPGVDVIVPAETSTPVTPPTAGAPVAVEVIGPLWTMTTTRPAATSVTAADAMGSQRHGRGPASRRRDLAVLAGATGTASSGGNSGGASGQADLPGCQGVGPRDGVDVVPAERWLLRPWCYVFGRHHPS
ncbi:hypothetical protein [Saccharothrix sp.]|uniref:hypothetical protein n=1 Tax=Saccharothrix sp. TaxID=1873460 RepID=UPI002811F554|nr:hypothetical protein [Saccharothrix sp.]